MWRCALPILTMTDEEVFCVCYPTDEEPAFRRPDDRICYREGQTARSDLEAKDLIRVSYGLSINQKK